MSATFLKDLIEQLVRFIEAAGGLVIFLGALFALVRFLDAMTRHRAAEHRFVAIRLGLGRYLTLGLEFQLAGDVLRTAVAPTLNELGILAAVASIRTALNFFLQREISQEQRQLHSEAGAPSS